jgi:exonuclease III
VTILPLNLAPGKYGLRYFSNDGYTVLAQTNFTVVSGTVAKALAPAGDLTVMTFNIWVQGTKGYGGLPAVANAIAKADADVVGLQESSSATTLQVLALLKLKPGYGSAVASGAAGVVSRYPITKTYTANGVYGYGVRVQLPGKHDIRFFNSHLTAYPYEPYSVRDKRKLSGVLEDEQKTRLPEMQAILSKLITDKNSDPCLPTFLVGDHNCPSHLDWTAANADQNFGVSLVWPVSDTLHKAGFRDLYREVHPDPVKTRGFTWTPGEPKNTFSSTDVHDRIDMIYFLPVAKERTTGRCRPTPTTRIRGPRITARWSSASTVSTSRVRCQEPT